MDRSKLTLYHSTLRYLSNEELQEVKQSDKYDTKTKKRASDILFSRGVYG